MNLCTKCDCKKDVIQVQRKELKDLNNLPNMQQFCKRSEILTHKNKHTFTPSPSAMSMISAYEKDYDELVLCLVGCTCKRVRTRNTHFVVELMMRGRNDFT